MKKILIFGAGKIGRSFIGQLFSRGGFHVVFVDTYRELIDALDRQGSYPVIIKSDKGDERVIIDHIRGIHLSETDRIIEEILSSQYIATAVGQANLPEIIPLIALGIRKKISQKGKRNHTDIIIAENLRNAAEYFHGKLEDHLTAEEIDHNVGLIETSIGKMVPIMTRSDLEQDITQVFAEPYNTLILDKKGFLNPLPDIPGLAPKENMKAWVDRKSFIHNLGHAAAAYYGFLLYPDRKYLYELLSDSKVLNFARSCMEQSGMILRRMYPGEFTRHQLHEHIEDLLHRFRNRSLGDTVFRVGMDLNRKLGRNDRLAGAVHNALKFNMPYGKILYALVCGMYFRAVDENGHLYPGDKQFAYDFNQLGLKTMMQNICGFDPIEHKDVFILSESFNIEIRSIIKNKE